MTNLASCLEFYRGDMETDSSDLWNLSSYLWILNSLLQIDKREKHPNKALEQTGGLLADATILSGHS